MATTKRARKSKQEKPTNSLLAALRFVALAQQEPGSIQQTHCMAQGGWLAACNGVMTAAAPTGDDLQACPQTARLVAALERSGEGVSITLTDGARLSVKSGALRAVVPCVDPSVISITGPDPMIAPLSETFAKACAAISHISSDSGQSVHDVSLLIAGKTLLSTNRQVIAEYWHGNDMPPHVVLPKQAVSAVLRSGKKLIGFGYSGNTFTFHFEDTCWLKTQLFEDKWPDFTKVFDKEKPGYTSPIPDGLFAAVQTIGDFSDCGQVKFESGMIRTVNANSDGAEHDVKALIESGKYAIKNLELIASIAKQISLPPGTGTAFFYGESLRGAISYYQS